MCHNAASIMRIGDKAQLDFPPHPTHSITQEEDRPQEQDNSLNFTMDKKAHMVARRPRVNTSRHRSQYYFSWYCERSAEMTS